MLDIRSIKTHTLRKKSEFVPSLLLGPLVLVVLLAVEVSEQHEHVDHHPKLQVGQPERGVLHVRSVKRVRGAYAELKHLDLRDIFLPEAVHPERREAVIRVHNDVHKRVNARAEVAVSHGLQLHHHEPRPDQQRVVVNVQEGQLVELLAHNHEEGVQQLNVLVVVVQPDHL
eukprot:1184251-Prorocentrum_minimum.AAC.3